METNEEKLSMSEALRRTARALRIWWRLCPGMLVSTALGAALTALSPYAAIWLSAKIIGELAGERSPERLARLVIIQLAVTAALSLATGIVTRWRNRERALADKMTDKLCRSKFFSMDYSALDNQRTFMLYNLMNQHMTYNGTGFERTLTLFENAFTAILQMAGGVALATGLFTAQVPAGSALAILNGLPGALLMAVLLVAAALLAPACSRQAVKSQERYTSTMLHTNRVASFYLFDVPKDEARRTDMRIYRQWDEVCVPQNAVMDEGIRRFGRAFSGPVGLWSALSQAASALLTGLIYGIVCLKAWAGAFGVGEVTQYVGAVSSLFVGFSALTEAAVDIQYNAVALGVLFEFLDIPNEMYKGSLTTEKRADRQYEVEFRNVSFRYPGAEKYALRHVNMKFKVGSRLAVVGENGSGKTTFIKLLCRLYDPTDGQILLNGIDIRKYRYDDYIGILSVVFQDYQLFALTLGQNVAGAESYDPERVRQCLEDAGFGSRLNTMPNGLDTVLYKQLDANGVEVSGGEAQKIAIARALYKDAPFIILDEPTAALDPIAEAEIYSKFNDIAGDKTAIYISHRLSSCKFCDEIAVFSEGEVVQKGTHEELVADEGGKYYELWHAQAQYYTAERAAAQR